MPYKSPKTSPKSAFNAAVIYQLHSNPPILGLHSTKLGYAEVDLAEFKLTQAEIDALSQASHIVGTYETLCNPVDVYHPIEGIKKSTWKVTSLKPSGLKPKG